jgi:hypothetical protein
VGDAERASATEAAITKLPLSQRVAKVAAFEKKIHELSLLPDGSVFPCKVALDYEADLEGISGEANFLIQKYGETLQSHKLELSSKSGITGGKWTCLSLNGRNGDICDDDFQGGTPMFPTRSWGDAPRIRRMLEPIQPALRRVRLSIMHPATMIEWHCDDCPKYFRTPEVEMPPMPLEKLVAKWKRKYHDWVRLHLVLTDTRDLEFAIGAANEYGTEAGSFYVANVAMPHRVDNKGTITRITLVIDVKVAGNRKLLKQSPIGHSILQAAQALKKGRNAMTYLQMGKALRDYRHDLSSEDRFEAEWYQHAWKTPLWRPLPPFQPEVFNSLHHCGVLGPPRNLVKMEALFDKPAKRSTKYKRMLLRRESRRGKEANKESVSVAP